MIIYDECTAGVTDLVLVQRSIKVLAPKLSAEQLAEVRKSGDDPKDPLRNEGNITPRITKRTQQEEAEILKDARAADGFDI